MGGEEYGEDFRCEGNLGGSSVNGQILGGGDGAVDGALRQYGALSDLKER